MSVVIGDDFGLGWRQQSDPNRKPPVTTSPRNLHHAQRQHPGGSAKRIRPGWAGAGQDFVLSPKSCGSPFAAPRTNPAA